MQDGRFNEERYERGYFVAYYWHAVVRFFYGRARREAQLFAVPLLWCQAADDIKGLDAQSSSEKAKIVKALMRQWNIHDTAHLHTLLLLYSGQRVRLTEKISPEHRIVQETEGAGPRNVDIHRSWGALQGARNYHVHLAGRLARRPRSGVYVYSSGTQKVL